MNFRLAFDAFVCFASIAMAIYFIYQWANRGFPLYGHDELMAGARATLIPFLWPAIVLLAVAGAAAFDFYVYATGNIKMTASGAARFQSRTDWWLATVLYIAVFISLGGASTLLFANAPGGLLANIALVLLGAVLPLWVLLHTHYTITDSGLRIISGPFRWRIPLHVIRSITPTRNPLSSPALSLDRLRIEYGRGKWIMVSPRDKEKFLQELRARGVTS